MRHEEILFRTPEYRAGLLGPRDRAAVDRHLADCAECRLLYARWKPVEPSAGFLDGVMAEVAGDDDVLAFPAPWMRGLLAWGTLAALLLVGLVFWRPERDWIKADRSFAWMDPGPGAIVEVVKGVRHE